MPNRPRRDRLRRQRNAFLVFLGAALVSLAAALPIVVVRLSGGHITAPLVLYGASFTGMEHK